MGRRPRIWYPGAVYHITNRGNGRANIFVEGDDRRLFLNKLSSIMKEHGIKLNAYCLMTNHYHLLLETGNVHIAESMRMLHTFYSKQYHLKYGTCGQLFQERYRSVLVQKENYLLEVSRYIHLTVRAGLVTLPEHYPWSSFRNYVNGDFGLIDPEPILASFALDVTRAREAYRRFVYAKLADENYSLEGLISKACHGDGSCGRSHGLLATWGPELPRGRFSWHGGLPRGRFSWQVSDGGKSLAESDPASLRGFSLFLELGGDGSCVSVK